MKTRRVLHFWEKYVSELTEHVVAFSIPIEHYVQTRPIKIDAFECLNTFKMITRGFGPPADSLFSQSQINFDKRI